MALDPIKELVSNLYDQMPPWGRAAAAGSFALLIYIPYKYYTSRPRSTPVKTDYKPGVVYLYQFRRFKQIPSISPYCLKLETWLRMADITYENVDCEFAMRSREGTLPFVEIDGKEYPDSGFAIRDVTKLFSKETMDAQLNEEKQAASRAFEKLAESSLVQSMAYIRYSEFMPQVLLQFPDNAFGLMTPFYIALMKWTFPYKMVNMLKMVGIGKHSRDEIVNIGNEDLKAISQYLGGKHYFHGFTPTRVDATLFGVVAQFVYAPYDLPQKQYILANLTNLVEYCDRIKGRFWPDWEECTTKFTLGSDWKKKV